MTATASSPQPDARPAAERARDRRLSRLAWVVAGVGLLMLLLTILFAVLRRSLGNLPGQTSWYGDVLFALSISVALVVGGFVAYRLPRNPIGWLVMAFGLGIGSIQGLAQNYGIFSYLVAPRPLPLASLSFIFAGIGLSLTLATAPLLFILYPSGRLPSRWWWLVVGPVLLALAALGAFIWRSPSAVMLPLPNPYVAAGPLGGAADAITSTAVLVLIFAIVISAAGLIVRGIRAKGIERQQFKWLGFAALSIVLVILANSELIPLLPGILDTLAEAVAFTAVPLAIGVAVLRYRLWDIDVIIRKTVQYAIVTALLAALYIGLIVGLQALFSDLTGQTSTVIVVLSTLVIAALFTPLRRRVQAAVDRRFYRQKYDAEQVLAEFAATLRDETDLDTLTAELLRVIQETMQPEFVSIWLQEPPRLAAVDSAPRDSDGRFEAGD
jgi:hypothetical protein